MILKGLGFQMNKKLYYLKDGHFIDRDGVKDMVDCGDLKLDDDLLETDESSAICLISFDLADMITESLYDHVESEYAERLVDKKIKEIKKLQSQVDKILGKMPIWMTTDKKIKIKDILK